jgi:hypothetical protein
VASEKEYPISYADLNINGRVFGAEGLAEGSTSAEVFHVNLERSYGTLYPVKLAMPVILPALIKLNWRDYFAGAAMAGVSCVVGEDARLKDPGLQLTDGKVTAYPWLAEILSSFNTYDRGYGQIIVQCNTEDDAAGVPEIALTEYGAKGIEFKFGQSAKGTQPVTLLKNREEALAKQAMGSLVHPNPSDPVVAKAYEEGVCPNFYVYARLPMWDEDFFAKRIQALRDVGMHDEQVGSVGLNLLFVEGKKGGAVVQVAGIGFKAENPSVFITAGLYGIGKDFFVFAFVKQAAFGVCGALHAFLFVRTGIVRTVFGRQFFFTVRFTVGLDFLIQFVLVAANLFDDFDALVFVPVGVGFDMGGVHELYLGVDESVVDGLFKNLLKDLFEQVGIFEAAFVVFSEGREMRNGVVEAQPQKPAVGNVHFDLFDGLPHAFDAEHVL